MAVLRWLTSTHGYHSWSSAGWSAHLLLLHRTGDLMTVATFVLVSAILAWGAAGTTERDRSKVRSWWKLVAFFMASAAVEGLSITVLLGLPLFNALGVAKVTAGVIGLLILTPAVYVQVHRLRQYVPPEVVEAQTRRAETAETQLRAKTREASRAVAQARELQERAEPMPGSDLAELQETANELRRLVAG